MALVIVEAVIELSDPSRRAACIESSLAIQRATRQDEPGCIVYSFAADPIVVGRIQVYELWQDEAALAAHFRHPNYKAMRASLRDFGLAKAESRKHLVAASAPVYGDDGVPTATFS